MSRSNHSTSAVETSARLSVCRSNAEGPNRIEFVVQAACRDRLEGGILLAKLAVIPSDDDARDVTLAADGDQTAFERLYRRHVPRVTSLARWLGDPADVDDAVQEIFLRVWQKLHTFAGQAAFST